MFGLNFKILGFFFSGFEECHGIQTLPKFIKDARLLLWITWTCSPLHFGDHLAWIGFWLSSLDYKILSGTKRPPVCFLHEVLRDSSMRINDFTLASNLDSTQCLKEGAIRILDILLVLWNQSQEYNLWVQPNLIITILNPHSQNPCLLSRFQ